jgi:hypothetical protein
MKLAGLLIIRDGSSRRWRAVRRELKRVGPLGLLDVLAFRALARLVHSRDNQTWEDAQIARLRERYPADLHSVPTLTVASPNTAEARAFVEQLQPDLAIARCKVLLDREIYEIPRAGTFVLHPGICPEYRNAHGCFWALANRDLSRVGMTLLRIDAGIDTGPFTCTAPANTTNAATRTSSSSNGPCSTTSTRLGKSSQRSLAATTSSRSIRLDDGPRCGDNRG